jgi:hypothetical protein
MPYVPCRSDGRKGFGCGVCVPRFGGYGSKDKHTEGKKVKKDHFGADTLNTQEKVFKLRTFDEL